MAERQRDEPVVWFWMLMPPPRRMCCSRVDKERSQPPVVIDRLLTRRRGAGAYLAAPRTAPPRTAQGRQRQSHPFACDDERARAPWRTTPRGQRLTFTISAPAWRARCAIAHASMTPGSAFTDDARRLRAPLSSASIRQINPSVQTERTPGRAPAHRLQPRRGSSATSPRTADAALIPIVRVRPVITAPFSTASAALDAPSYMLALLISKPPPAVAAEPKKFATMF